MRNTKPYSDAEKQFLAENVHDHSYETLSRMFFERFGRYVKSTALKQYCRNRLKVQKPEKCGFQKGKPPACTLESGSEVVVAGRIYVKAATSGRFSERFRPKSEVLYGDIPEGKILIFADGNPLNCTMENIRCIDKATHVKMAKNQWFAHEPELVDTAIKWCELHEALKREG